MSCNYCANGIASGCIESRCTCTCHDVAALRDQLATVTAKVERLKAELAKSKECTETWKNAANMMKELSATDADLAKAQAVVSEAVGYECGVKEAAEKVRLAPAIGGMASRRAAIDAILSLLNSTSMNEDHQKVKKS